MKKIPLVNFVITAFGLFVICFSLMGLFIVNANMKMFASKDPAFELIQKPMHIGHDVLSTYLPFLCFIGVAYALFGILYKQSLLSTLIGVFLLALSLVWSVKYVDALGEYFKVLNAVMPSPTIPFIHDMSRFQHATTYVSIIGMMIAPSIFLFIHAFVNSIRKNKRNGQSPPMNHANEITNA